MGSHAALIAELEQAHPSVGPMEAQALMALATGCGTENPEYYFPFRAIAKASGLPQKKVRRAVRSLARKGLAKYARGLWCEYTDRPAGAGYSCTELGCSVYNSTLKAMETESAGNGTGENHE